MTLFTSRRGGMLIEVLQLALP